MRYFKIAAACIIGFIGLSYFLANAYNFDSAQQFVSTVLSGGGEEYYKIIGPTFENKFITLLALLTIMTGELTVGVLAFKGAFDMFKARSADAATFKSAKKFALYGGATAMVVWYGFFMAVGESYFQMWQYPLGVGSIDGAFRYASMSGILMLFIALVDDD